VRIKMLNVHRDLIVHSPLLAVDPDFPLTDFPH